LLIADDVGVGKTIEAALIARELLDRGEARRLAVLCPPYLCDQWQKELAEKFHIDAVCIRSGTVSRLEREAPPDRSIFQHHRHFVASIDLVKGERYRSAFLQHCPDLVLVDEVHGAAQPPSGKRSHAQQQRHELLKEVAKDPKRHLILLTATPHSGVEESFRSILALLAPEFGGFDLTRLSEGDRASLARCFVQRRRGDVKQWLGEETPFPERENEEATYQFSPAYRQFYEAVYRFARDLVQSAETLSGWKRRMRFWSALALMRCVASSPAAAEAALLKRAEDKVTPSPPHPLAPSGFGVTDTTTDEELDSTFEPVVHDLLDAESVVDAPPSSVFDLQEQDRDFPDTDRRRLRQFARDAQQLRGDADTKLRKLVDVVRRLLRDGFHPIIWCRYIATADYVAEQLEHQLNDEGVTSDTSPIHPFTSSPVHPLTPSSVRVVSVTGALSDDQRRLKVEELAQSPRRVLVATDCLSEGINLQEHFNAVVHYDLPWNPNRLEQREGRVDRFGQTASKVKAVLIFGQDNPVDGAVLEVLLRKARDIHRDLGVHVPIPIDSESVMEAVMRSLFSRARYQVTQQLRLFDADDEGSRFVRQVHEKWEQAADREKASRTRFAQHAIKPEEVEQELRETDRVLGRPDDVRLFLQEASQRLGFAFHRVRDGVWELDTAALPPPVRQQLRDLPSPYLVTFNSPTPDGVIFVGRSHALVEALAEYLVDMAFHPPDGDAPAARCGVIRTSQVSRRTTLLLLRLRSLIYERGDETPILAEETLTWGFEGLMPHITPLSVEQAKTLLDNAQAHANVPVAEKREVLEETLSWWEGLQKHLQLVLSDRAKRLEDSHKRIRQLLHQPRVRIEPQSPPDLLGVLVLLPVPEGVRG
jgi:hypothetical protein